MAIGKTKTKRLIAPHQTLLFQASAKINGAHDQNRTGEPLPYQGSALPTELHGQHDNPTKMCYADSAYGAGDEVRTRDIQLGRLKLYQLSYSRL